MVAEIPRTIVMSLEEAWKKRLEEYELDTLISQFFGRSRSEEAEASSCIPKEPDLHSLLGLAGADVNEFLADIVRNEYELLEVDADSRRLAGFDHRRPTLLVRCVHLPIRMSCHKPN